MPFQPCMRDRRVAPALRSFPIATRITRAAARGHVMTVKDICNRNVVVAPKTEMIVDAAKRMRTSHVGALVVVDNSNGRQVPIGIVTDRDIVVGGLAGDPEHLVFLLVGDLMCSDLVTARESDTIDAALRKMHEHGVRRLPIVDEAGELVGILTLDDVLQYLTAQQHELVSLVAREQRHERAFRL
jgi:CBS domain-containing protein